MKLFLASSLDKTALLLKSLLPKANCRVAFISNAADIYKGDNWWIESDGKALREIGCEIVDVDLRQMTEESFSEVLKNVDVVHFCGGSVLYLIGLIKEKKLKDLIVDFVKKGGLYTGTSAGSMIVASDLLLSTTDPEEKDYLGTAEIKEYSGLGLVDFLIIPHCNNPEFVAGNKDLVELMPQTNRPLIWLYDNQVVLVEDNKFEILSV